jgi:hypothetical protein
MSKSDFWENVDWQKLDEISLEKALREVLEGDNPTAEKVTERWKYWYDYIWLMGPLPMKEGYEPPKFDFKFYF